MSSLHLEARSKAVLGYTLLRLLPLFDERTVQETLSELVRMLEEKSAKTEILRFLTFRLDFNE